MFTTRQEAEKYLEKYIPSTVKKHFPAKLGLDRAAKLLELLEKPQEKYRVVHVTGTSGKGTTALLASRLLTTSGKRVGLHLSPHLEDIRERMMIDGKFISDKKFLAYLSDVLKAAEKCEDVFSKPSYFEILTALAMYTFAKERVDIAVIETGMGGTFDATNVVKRRDKIAVITKIGHDHTNILGNTLKEISAHKAGIIGKGNAVVALRSRATDQVFKKRAEEKNATLFLLDYNNIQNVRISPKGIVFDFSFQNYTLKNLEMSLFGKHQAENVSEALTAALLIAKMDDNQIRATLSNARFKGRIDILKRGDKTIVIDGAHNKQKMKALTKALTDTFPNQKFTVILSIKKGKAASDMLRLLAPLTETLIITTFFKNTHDLIHIAHDTKTLARKARALGFKNVTEAPTVTEAAAVALRQKNDYILSTGSLYYLQDVYNSLAK